MEVIRAADDTDARATKGTIDSLNITFLGTTSATPTATRNHSSLALQLDADVWLFDCGEATQHQIRRSGTLKMNTIKKIFITHTHGDHIFGLCPLLASCMKGPLVPTQGPKEPRPASLSFLTLSPKTDITGPQPLEIYGPLGTRAYIRNSLFFTHTSLDGSYVVHELRFPTDPQDGDYTTLSRPPFEFEGRNIPQVDGIWGGIYSDTTVSVSAAPIYHSVPCVGYVINELLTTTQDLSINPPTQPPPSPQQGRRKIVILGDTHDPSPITTLARDADLLIHEATNSYLLPEIDPNTKPTDTYESVYNRAKSRGHSTPQMAGAFAKRIGAKQVVLNHFSSRYPGDDSDSTRRMMEAIGRLAAEEFGREVVCARDFLSLDVRGHSGS